MNINSLNLTSIQNKNIESQSLSSGEENQYQIALLNSNKADSVELNSQSNEKEKVQEAKKDLNSAMLEAQNAKKHVKQTKKQAMKDAKAVNKTQKQINELKIKNIENKFDAKIKALQTELDAKIKQAQVSSSGLENARAKEKECNKKVRTANINMAKACWNNLKSDFKQEIKKGWPIIVRQTKQDIAWIQNKANNIMSWASNFINKV